MAFTIENGIISELKTTHTSTNLALGDMVGYGTFNNGAASGGGWNGIANITFNINTEINLNEVYFRAGYTYKGWGPSDPIYTYETNLSAGNYTYTATQLFEDGGYDQVDVRILGATAVAATGNLKIYWDNVLKLETSYNGGVNRWAQYITYPGIQDTDIYTTQEIRYDWVINGV